MIFDFVSVSSSLSGGFFGKKTREGVNVSMQNMALGSFNPDFNLPKTEPLINYLGVKRRQYALI